MMAAKKTENLLERGAGVENLIHIEEDSVYKWPSTYYNNSTY